jgi:hypothetical protein
MLAPAACGALVATCVLVTESGTLPPPYAPRFAIAVEPETVRVHINAERRSQLDVHVRLANHGPGSFYIPDCGHELERAEPNGKWVRVHTVPCRNTAPPLAVDVGKTVGYAIRVAAPTDSAPWQRGQIAGRYRNVTHFSTTCHAGSKWGRPVAYDRCVSPEFVVRETP